MAGFSNYWRNKAVSHLFGKEVYTPSATKYVGLSLSDPGRDGLGVLEPTGGGYSRVSASSDVWGLASGGTIRNASAIQFVATGSWGTVSYFVVYDSPTGGNLLCYGTVTPIAITVGTWEFAIGAMSVTLTLPNYVRDQILNHMFGKATYTAPASYYLGMSSSDPLVDGSGLAEPVGGGYGRVINDSGDWDDVSGGETLNVNPLVFSMATDSQGTMTYYVIFDSPTENNMLVYGGLSEPLVVAQNNAVTFSVGKLSASIM